MSIGDIQGKVWGAGGGEMMEASWTCAELVSYEECDLPLDEREALRYAGVPASAAVPEETTRAFRRALAVAQGHFRYRVSFLRGPISWNEDGSAELPFGQRSADLARNLAGCSAAVVFAATVGADIDRLIARYERAEAGLAVLLHGLGAERVEALCDAFAADLRTAAAMRGYKTHPRFSPGYGDLPLAVQPEVLALTDAGRRLGITLTETLLMRPSKSVTGIIGLERIEEKTEEN